MSVAVSLFVFWPPRNGTTVSTDVPFREVQRFRQRWLWALLGIVGAVSVASGGPVGLLVTGAIVVFVWSLRLTTEVREDGLYVRFWPFHRSFEQVPWRAIAAAESVHYRPLSEYGGWGIRWRPGRVAYNVRGSRGVYLTGHDRRDILLGSQQPDELAAAIRQRMREADR